MSTWTDRNFENEEFDAKTFREVAPDYMERCRFSTCGFSGLRLDELKTHGCEFDECKFVGSKLASSHHLGSSFLNCDFTGADCFGAHFEKCRMVGSVFEVARLDAIRITEGDWSFTVLRMQDLAKLDLSGVLFKGADFFSSDLRSCTLRNANLSGANLGLAKLQKADLRGADLSGVDLRTAELKGARMTLDQAALFAMSYGIVLE